MKIPLVTRFVSVLAVVPTLLSAQPVRDRVPLRHWPVPLHWQPDLAELRPLVATPTQPNPLTLIAMTPCRVVDTRAGFGFSGAFGPPSLAGGTSRTFPMQSSTTCSIPATAQAYSLNVTVVPQGPLGYITAYPSGQPQPVVSTLNSLQGFIVANAAIVPAGTSGSIDIFASNPTDLVIDINGYYAPEDEPITLASLAGPWQMTLTGDTGCGISTSVVTFTLDGNGSGSTTIRSHTSGCGDPVGSGTPFVIQSLNPNGSGTANLSCGPGCGWNLIIQVAKNRQIFNVVDVDPLNPNNYLEGTAIHQ